MIGLLSLWKMVSSEVRVLANTDSLAYAWKVAWITVWWHRNKGLEQTGIGFVEYSLYGAFE